MSRGCQSHITPRCSLTWHHCFGSRWLSHGSPLAAPAAAFLLSKYPKHDWKAIFMCKWELRRVLTGVTDRPMMWLCIIYEFCYVNVKVGWCSFNFLNNKAQLWNSDSRGEKSARCRQPRRICSRLMFPRICRGCVWKIDMFFKEYRLPSAYIWEREQTYPSVTIACLIELIEDYL